MTKCIRPRVKISKNCKGSFGSLMSYFWGPHNLLRAQIFLLSLMGSITVSLSPQNLRALRARQVLIFRPASNFAGHWPEGLPYFNPCIRRLLYDDNATKNTVLSLFSFNVFVVIHDLILLIQEVIVARAEVQNRCKSEHHQHTDGKTCPSVE